MPVIIITNVKINITKVVIASPLPNHKQSGMPINEPKTPPLNLYVRFQESTIALPKVKSSLRNSLVGIEQAEKKAPTNKINTAISHTLTIVFTDGFSLANNIATAPSKNG